MWWWWPVGIDFVRFKTENEFLRSFRIAAAKTQLKWRWSWWLRHKVHKLFDAIDSWVEIGYLLKIKTKICMQSGRRINLWEFTMRNWCQLRHRIHAQRVNWSWINVGPIGSSRNSVHTSFEYVYRVIDVSVTATAAVCCLQYARVQHLNIPVSPKNAIVNKTRCDTSKKNVRFFPTYDRRSHQTRQNPFAQVVFTSVFMESLSMFAYASYAACGRGSSKHFMRQPRAHMKWKETKKPFAALALGIPSAFISGNAWTANKKFPHKQHF